MAFFSAISQFGTSASPFLVHEETSQELQLYDMEECLKELSDDAEKDVSNAKFAATVLRLAKNICLVIANCLLSLLPSFVLQLFSSGPEVATNPRPTAFLDGLRGLAAWSVFNLHLAAAIYEESIYGWGYKNRYYEVFRLPIIRLVYAGSFAVGLFFVISGYALSVTYFRYVNEHSADSKLLLRHFASSILRRPVRLLLPAWTSTTLAMILVRLGYMEEFKERLDGFKPLIVGISQLIWLAPARLPTVWAQMKDLWRTNMSLLQIFDNYLVEKGVSHYNSNTWTIPLELRGSLMLYLMQAVLIYIRSGFQSWMISLLILVGVMVDAYELPLFLAGLLIAKHSNLTGEGKRRLVAERAFWWLVLICGCIIGSFIEWEPENTPLYSWMLLFRPFSYKPAFRFFTGFGSALTVLAISKIPILQAMLNVSLIQYLGRISFGLYLVHIWIVNGIGIQTFYSVWTWTGKSSLITHVVGFLIAYSLIFALTVWVADVFWRLIDMPSIALGRLMEQWIMVQ